MFRQIPLRPTEQGTRSPAALGHVIWRTRQDRNRGHTLNENSPVYGAYLLPTAVMISN